MTSNDTMSKQDIFEVPIAVEVSVVCENCPLLCAGLGPSPVLDCLQNDFSWNSLLYDLQTYLTLDSRK